MLTIASADICHSDWRKVQVAGIAAMLDSVRQTIITQNSSTALQKYRSSFLCQNDHSSSDQLCQAQIHGSGAQGSNQNGNL